MLTLKLVLVPAFLLLVTLAGKRWGPSVAGCVAGLPLVAGPILLFLALEHGPAFASNASSAALSAVAATLAFSAAYAHLAQRVSWWLALPLALFAWAAAAAALSWLPGGVMLSLLVSLLALISAPRLFPALRSRPATLAVSTGELGCRMLAGAALTLAVTAAANHLGAGWSGLLAVFPVLGSVLAVFSHRGHGAALAAVLLRAMASGLYAFATFCFTLSTTLPHAGIAGAFAMATAAALAVQAGTLWFLARTSGKSVLSPTSTRA